MTQMNTYGLIGLTEENVGVDRRFYTGYTSTNGTFAVSYNAGRVDVFLNGIKLVGNHSGNSNYDYTMDSTTGTGSTITLATGVALVLADVLECVGYVSNSSNTVTSYNPTPSSGDGGFNEFRNITHTASDLVNVFLNGVLLDDSDYTLAPSTNGGTVTIGSPTITASDVVVIQVIGALDNSNFVPVGGGTFSGNVTVPNLTLSSNVIKASDGGSTITLDTSDNVTLAGNLVIPDGGNIGSASDTDAISISSGGVVTASASIQTDTISEKTSANGVSIDGLKIKDDSVMNGNYTGVSISSDGYVNKPNQPIFSAYLNSQFTNIVNGGWRTIPFDMLDFACSHFNTSTSEFTTPIAGKYQFNVYIRIDNIHTAASYYQLSLNAGGSHYYGPIVDPNFSADLIYYGIAYPYILNLGASTAVKLQIYQAAGTNQTDIQAGNNQTKWSGYLIG